MSAPKQFAEQVVLRAAAPEGATDSAQIRHRSSDALIRIEHFSNLLS